MSKLGVLFIGLPGPGQPAGKLYGKIDGREVFMRTLELYTPRDQVQQRIFCVSADDLALVQQKYAAHLGFQGVSVTAGGLDWFGAVARGLEKLQPDIDRVLIHDAAAPLVPHTLLDQLEQRVEKAEAAAPALAFHGLLVQAASDQTLHRVDIPQPLQQLQSPQIFRRESLEKAYQARAALSGVFQDDATLLAACGQRVALVPGARINQRIDSDDLLRYAADLLKHLPKPRSKAAFSPFDEAQW